MTDPATILFGICSADSTAQSFLLSEGTFRLFPAGAVEQEQTVPYATHAIVGGHVENSMDSPSRADNARIQLDTWGDSRDEAKTISQALRDAYENTATQSAYGVGIRTIGPNPEYRDPKTKRYCVSLDLSLWVTS